MPLWVFLFCFCFFTALPYNLHHPHLPNQKNTYVVIIVTVYVSGMWPMSWSFGQLVFHWFGCLVFYIFIGKAHLQREERQTEISIHGFIS